MRRAFLFLAAGLLASVAVSAPARAGNVLYTVTSDVVVTAGTATTATYTFTNPVFAPVTVTSTTLPTPVVGVAGSPGADNIKFTFAAAGPGSYVLDFTVESASFPVLAGVGGTVGGGTNPQGGVVVLSITQSVPEPASLALLGIGMTGFLAFRRFFKKTAIA